MIQWPGEKRQAALNKQFAELSKQVSDLSNLVEEMRLAQKASSEPQDVELDSNWHIRRRKLEQQYAKGRSSDAK